MFEALRGSGFRMGRLRVVGLPGLRFRAGARRLQVSPEKA